MKKGYRTEYAMGRIFHVALCSAPYCKRELTAKEMSNRYGLCDKHFDEVIEDDRENYERGR